MNSTGKPPETGCEPTTREKMNDYTIDMALLHDLSAQLTQEINPCYRPHLGVESKTCFTNQPPLLSQRIDVNKCRAMMRKKQPVFLSH